MNDIIKSIANKEFCINLIHKYFDGRYTKDQISDRLYKEVPFNDRLSVREGVALLADEWNKIDSNDPNQIKQWYKDTENYIFDLLPWNSSDMFKTKIDEIMSKIIDTKITSMIDYGAGLGITTILFSQSFPHINVTYCDFKDSHQYKFFNFLCKELEIDMKNIQVIDVDEFLTSPKKYDLLVAVDCFGHIPDLESTLKIICNKSNMIIHDSVFDKTDIQPQHIDRKCDNANLWFFNIMLENGFVGDESIKVFKKFVLQHNGKEFYLKIHNQ